VRGDTSEFFSGGRSEVVEDSTEELRHRVAVPVGLVAEDREALAAARGGLASSAEEPGDEGDGEECVQGTGGKGLRAEGTVDFQPLTTPTVLSCCDLLWGLERGRGVAAAR